MSDDHPLTTCCARTTDICVCNLVGEICGHCHEAGVFPLPPRLQPDEDYLIVHRCEACGYTFTTDTRDGR